jgi:hypothetical protein
MSPNIPSDNRAISSVNLLLNDIGIDQAKDLVIILKDHPTLKTLCGIKGDETTLDMSGKMRGAGDAIMLVPDIIDNGALSVLSLKKNNLCNREAAKALSEMLAVNTVLTEIDVSENTHYKCDSAGFAQELAVGIIDNGAISSINLLKNCIPVEQAQELVQIMQAKENLFTLCGLSKEETELDFGGQNLRAGDAVLIANDISDMEAVVRLDISSNNLVGEKGTGRYETVDAQYSDASDEEEEIMESDFSGIFAIANAIPNMRALTTLDISSNGLGVPDQLPDGWIFRPHFTELQRYQHTDERMPFHERFIGHPPTGSKFRGLDALANAIRDMGALSTANFMGNNIGKEMLSMLQEIMHSNPNLVSLCGIADNATEADLSGLNMDADDASILASELPDKVALTSLNISTNKICGTSGWINPPRANMKVGDLVEGNPVVEGPHSSSGNIKVCYTTGVVALADGIKNSEALAKFDISDNDIRAEGGKALAEALKGNQVITELSAAGNRLVHRVSGGVYVTDMSGVTALAAAIPDMEALTKLNIGRNHIGAEQEQDLQRICVTSGIELAK